MKVLRLTHAEMTNDSGASCVYEATNCPSLLEEINQMQYCEVDEKWIITVEEMAEKEFKELPEFIGW